VNSTSLFGQLEPLLSRVAKPVQYVGGEVNSMVKDWDACTVRWVLSYPDAYEIGMSNQGTAILLEILNAESDVLAERSFAVWPDLATLMREAGIPQFTLDSHRPVASFDLVGVSLATELAYTNLLEFLDLAGIPIRSRDRGPEHPIVVVGGHCAANPEPLADFVDAVVLGDGEEAVLEITAVVRESKTEGGRSGVGRRQDLLRRLAAVPGVYVPSCHDVEYAGDGRIRRVVPNEPGVPWRIEKRVISDLDEWPHPRRPVVPLAEAIHERAAVEIFRGCTRGCRFCQAGMITRPVRERSPQAVCSLLEDSLAAGGLDEAGLLSLSSADYSGIESLVNVLADRFADDRVSLSLPSTRVDSFNIELARGLSQNGRRSGLTFAPEGGSERLRQVINKRVSKEDLIDTVAAAYSSGWRQVKLYFMCGLPTETDDDVLEIADLARDVIRTGREVSGRRDIRCTVSIGGFIPKPHTPFQWAGQLDWQATDDRLARLRSEIRQDREVGRAIGFRYHDGRPGIIEGLLARGDRRVGRVIEEAWRSGARFDGWSEWFSFERWERAAEVGLAGSGVDLDWFTTRERSAEEVLPWDHLDYGLDRDWLWDDWQDALAETEVADCRWDPCSNCGVCDRLGVDIRLSAE